MVPHPSPTGTNSTRAHWALLVGVATVAALVLVWGRNQAEPSPDRTTNSDPSLTLRSPVALSIGDESRSAQRAGHLLPIPLPGTATRTPQDRDDFLPPLRLNPAAASERNQPQCMTRGPTIGLDSGAADHSPDREHRVVEGESLESISQLYFGNADRAGDIFELNRDRLSHPEILPLGERLRIPMSVNP